MLLLLLVTPLALALEVAWPRAQHCPPGKEGTNTGEATMFQEAWVHGKTGACGYERPNTAIAEGFFTAVGTADWDGGFACGTCAELSYQGNTITVNVVDKGEGHSLGAVGKGWFDLGGPAWRALTGGAPPGRARGVASRWVACPADLTGGGNMLLYFKPGSHAWDARIQPVSHTLPVRAMQLKAGGRWRNMRKCENYMFCKPGGVTLHGAYTLRVLSDSGKVEIRMDGIPEGSFVDTGANNGGPCSSGGTHQPTTHRPTTHRPTTHRPTTHRPTTAAPTTPAYVPPSFVDCSLKEGLFPDPHNCRGFIKCAQGDPYHMVCPGGLYFDPVTYNCNWSWNTDCQGRPVLRGYFWGR